MILANENIPLANDLIITTNLTNIAGAKIENVHPNMQPTGWWGMVNFIIVSVIFWLYKKKLFLFFIPLCI